MYFTFLLPSLLSLVCAPHPLCRMSLEPGSIFSCRTLFSVFAFISRRSPRVPRNVHQHNKRSDQMNTPARYQAHQLESRAEIDLYRQNALLSPDQQCKSTLGAIRKEERRKKVARPCVKQVENVNVNLYSALSLRNLYCARRAIVISKRVRL